MHRERLISVNMDISISICVYGYFHFYIYMPMHSAESCALKISGQSCHAT